LDGVSAASDTEEVSQQNVDFLWGLFAGVRSLDKEALVAALPELGRAELSTSGYIADERRDRPDLSLDEKVRSVEDRLGGEHL
jgi:hypothetical protein